MARNYYYQMDITGLLYILYLCLFILCSLAWSLSYYIYLVHSTDDTRSQTGDTDWKHKPTSKLFCGKKENYAQAATVIYIMR